MFVPALTAYDNCYACVHRYEYPHIRMHCGHPATKATFPTIHEATRAFGHCGPDASHFELDRRIKLREHTHLPVVPALTSWARLLAFDDD